MDYAEVSAGLAVAENPVEEPPGVYRNSGSLQPAHPARGPFNTVPMVNAAFAPRPPEPTRAQIDAHVKAYLDTAERVPGGIGFAWVQIKRTLKPQELEELAE